MTGANGAGVAKEEMGTSSMCTSYDIGGAEEETEKHLRMEIDEFFTHEESQEARAVPNAHIRMVLYQWTH